MPESSSDRAHLRYGSAGRTMSAERLSMLCRKRGLTPRLTGAGARSAEGTNTGHENAEGMASVGVRVEPTVRLGRVGRVWQVHSGCVRFKCSQNSGRRLRAEKPQKWLRQPRLEKLLLL